MSIIDSFMFNGERIALLRVKYLYDAVDLFVITESWYTHSGKKKGGLFFEKMRKEFEPYMSKIKFVVIENFESWMGSWNRENLQRSYAFMNGTLDHIGPYIVVVGDADEIINRDILLSFRKDEKSLMEWYDKLSTPHFLEMRFFYYSFRWEKPYPWTKAFIINDRWLKNAKGFVQPLRNFEAKDSKDSLILKNAGWHCSFFMNPTELHRKLESFAHTEFDYPIIKNMWNITDAIQTGRDIFMRSSENCIEVKEAVNHDLEAIWQSFSSESPTNTM